MATTALFVEILIVGFEAALWLAGLAMVFGWRPPGDWQPLKDVLPLLTLGLLGIAYVMGIVVDRGSDSAYRAIRRGLRRLGLVEPDEPTPAPVSVMRLWVMKESDGISKFIDYQRSRVRIARATVFNLLPGTVVAAVYVWRQGSGGCVIGGVVGAGFILALLAFVAAERIHRAHEDRLAEAYLMLSRHSILDEVAAAVCYRRTTNAVQFLLVRTKGGRYWTFPKGHIKKKERDRPWEAARREASEEAGARGTVRQLPLAYYRYPAKGEKAPGAHYRVAAYLLEVSGPLGVYEDGRDPTWCAAPEAKARLMEGGREKIYVTEQQLVIDAALDALGVAG